MHPAAGVFIGFLKEFWGLPSFSSLAPAMQRTQQAQRLVYKFPLTRNFSSATNCPRKADSCSLFLS